MILLAGIHLRVTVGDGKVTKTRPTSASIEDDLAARASDAQLADCRALMAVLQKVTAQQPPMWGPSIVGYGRYRYRYQCESGRTGESWMGKACLYFKQWADLDATVLEALMSASVAETRRRHPDAGGAAPRSPSR